jgi:hypothetical protein
MSVPEPVPHKCNLKSHEKAMVMPLRNVYVARFEADHINRNTMMVLILGVPL